MDKALQTMINNMPEKTGKSLDEWKKILNTKSFEKHSEGVKYLKSEYSVTHGFANTIITLSKEDDNTSEDLVESQYKGKEDLIPIYKEIKERTDISLCASMGLITEEQLKRLKIEVGIEHYHCNLETAPSQTLGYVPEPAYLITKPHYLYS